LDVVVAEEGDVGVGDAFRFGVDVGDAFFGWVLMLAMRFGLV